MKKLLFLFPLIGLSGACDYYGFITIRNRSGIPELYNLDVVKYVVWVLIVIDCLLILRDNKRRQDEYRELIDSIGKEEETV